MPITAAAIEANGWVLQLTVAGAPGSFASYVLDPNGSPRAVLTSVHPGFARSGGVAVAGNLARSLVATKPLRLPVNPASPDTDVIDETDLGGGAVRVRIALSEHVYATDTGLALTVAAGWRTGEAAAVAVVVTNASTVVAPIPIMRWALLPYGVTSGAFTLALFVASHHPQGFDPVAAVKFTATDGTTVKTVWAAQLSTDTSYGDNLRCYTASINPATATALTAGLLRCDAEVYPWLGAMRSTDTAGTRSMAAARTDGYLVDAAAPWIIGHDPAGTRYGAQFAFVDPVNGTATAAATMVAATLAGARAVAPTARPRDINTAIQAGYLANRTLPAANGLAAANRSVDGMQIVLAAGTHATGSTTVTSGLVTAEIPVRITGDPADANPRVNCILPTSASALTSRASRVMFQSLTAEIGVNAFGSSLYYMLDNCIVRGRAGQEASSVAAFTSAPPAGQWSAAIVRTRWWRTASFIGAGNSRFGLMRNCEASRSVANTLVAIKNRLIPAAEDGFVGALVFTAFSGWNGAALAGQVEDTIVAWNDVRSLRGRAWAHPTLPAATAGTPNPSVRRQVFIGNLCERIGADPQPFFSVGEGALATMSYNIIEGNSFVGERANTFYSDPVPVTLADTNNQRNQAFVNRVAGNAFDRMPTKHDKFFDSTTAAIRGTSDGYRPQMVEAWSALYGVGHEANVDTRRSISTPVTNNMLEFPGLKTLAGYAGVIEPLYTDDRSQFGSGSGGGNYRPRSPSPLAGRAMRANGDVDADGAVRRVPFAVGAYQVPAVDLVPATTRSTQRSAATSLQPTLVSASAQSATRGDAAVVGWTTGLEAQGGKHALSGVASLGWSAVLGAGGAAHGLTGDATVSWAAVLDPAVALSGQAAGGAAAGIDFSLVATTLVIGVVSTSPALVLENLLTIDPASCRIDLAAAGTTLFAGGSMASAVLVVGSDPRTLIAFRD